MPLDRIGHLLYQVTVPCLGDITALPNTYRNKHREAAKMWRQRNMAQMKEENKTPEKELNKMEISNLSDAEFKTLFIRMHKELIGYFNSIKKI